MALWHPTASRVGVVLLVTGALACGGPTPDTAARPDYRQVAERLSAFIEHEMADKELPAVSVVLVDDQETVWAEGFGWEDPTDSVPATAETVYRVGSVSKLFTDLGIMQAVERGDVDLDQPVAEILPGFAPESEFDKPVTLRQLMSHRAGLVREPPAGHYFDDTGPSLEATVASLNSTRAVYEPEARTKYSNAGIATVGYVLEHMSGEPFAEYLKEAVLEPLGMAHSSFLPEPHVVDRLATAYMWTYDGRTFEAPNFQLGMAPAGSMYAPVTDLGLFMQALFADGRGREGVVVSPSTLQAMLQPQFAEPGATTGYGIGFRLSEFGGQRAIGHGGAIYGFATDLAALPDAKLGAAAVTSMDVANTVVSRITRYALELMLAASEGRPLPEAETTHQIPEDLVESVAGRYGSGDESVEIRVRGRDAYARLASSGMRVRLRAIGDTLVVDDRLAYGMRILPAPEGVMVNGRLRERSTATLPEPAPPGWNGLIGEYGWDHNTLYVLEREGRLHALIEWFFEYPLEEISPDVFAFPDWGLYHGERLIFRRDGEGKASEVEAASVVFHRREVGTEAGETFTIDPVRPVDELRVEALGGAPPSEEGDFLDSDLVDLRTLDATVRYDIRYATTNNFMQSVFYDEARAFLQRPAAQALVRAHRKLGDAGYGLLIHDAYRPWYVTKMFWDATPADKKIFVANPANGSRHNRGAAVDLTLYDLTTGEPVPMVGGYDEMSDRSFPAYPGGTSRQRWHRELLRDAMEAEGFEVYEFEWWHFDYGDWARYPIQNLTFDRIR